MVTRTSLWRWTTCVNTILVEGVVMGRRATIGQRQIILSWWIHHRMDSHDGVPSPENIQSWVQEAENDLEYSDRVLTNSYDDYVPQF